MTPSERRRAFEAERRRRLRALGTITARTRATLIKELRALEQRVITILRAQPTEWQAIHYQAVRRELQDAIARFEVGGQRVWREGAAEAWQAGIALVDAPLAAGGLNIGPLLPAINDAQLGAMQSFLTNRIVDISAQAVTRINGQLLATLGGVQAPAETAAAIQQILGVSRSRAITITRTEVGRAFSVATQQRLEDATRRVPGLKKQWRRSGKLHSRLTHDAADGQVREVDEPFDVGGEQLMYPRDPTGSAKNTINCGCDSLPWKEDWEDVANPAGRPFSPDELAAQPLRRDLGAPGG